MRAAEKSRPGSLIQAFDAEPDQAQEPSGAPAAKTDWKGISGRDLGEDREVVVRDAGSWISLWALLSPEAVPLIDFGEEMVVGVVLASPDPGGKGGEGGNLLSVETSGQGMVVRYEGPRPGPHTLGGEGNRVFLYHLRAVPRTDRPVRFQRR